MGCQQNDSLADGYLHQLRHGGLDHEHFEPAGELDRLPPRTVRIVAWAEEKAGRALAPRGVRGRAEQQLRCDLVMMGGGEGRGGLSVCWSALLEG